MFSYSWGPCPPWRHTSHRGCRYLPSQALPCWAPSTLMNPTICFLCCYLARASKGSPAGPPTLLLLPDHQAPERAPVTPTRTRPRPGPRPPGSHPPPTLPSPLASPRALATPFKEPAYYRPDPTGTGPCPLQALPTPGQASVAAMSPNSS